MSYVKLETSAGMETLSKDACLLILVTAGDLCSHVGPARGEELRCTDALRTGNGDVRRLSLCYRGAEKHLGNTPPRTQCTPDWLILFQERASAVQEIKWDNIRSWCTSASPGACWERVRNERWLIGCKKKLVLRRLIIFCNASLLTLFKTCTI